MIFYRSNKVKDGPGSLNVKSVRWLSIAALTLYPTGAITTLVGGIYNEKVLELLGYGGIFGALVCATGIVGSGLQRITAEEKDKLDEMELSLRQRATASAYHMFGAVVLLGVMYLGIASDSGARFTFWMPTNFDHWNAIIWGLILLLAVLPTSVLAWTLPADEIEDDMSIQSQR